MSEINKSFPGVSETGIFYLEQQIDPMFCFANENVYTVLTI